MDCSLRKNRSKKNILYFDIGAEKKGFFGGIVPSSAISFWRQKNGAKKDAAPTGAIESQIVFFVNGLLTKTNQ